MLGLGQREASVLLALLLSLWAGGNPAASRPGVLFGVNFTESYPEFGVSALRFYVRILMLWKDMPEDVATKAAGGAFAEYEGMLESCYGGKMWVKGIKTGLAGLGGSEEKALDRYAVDVLREAERSEPDRAKRKELADSASRLYAELLRGSDLRASRLSGEDVMTMLHDVVMGMMYKAQR